MQQLLTKANKNFFKKVITLASEKRPRETRWARRERGKRGSRLSQPRFCAVIFHSPMKFRFSLDGLSWVRGRLEVYLIFISISFLFLRINLELFKAGDAMTSPAIVSSTEIKLPYNYHLKLAHLNIKHSVMKLCFFFCFLWPQLKRTRWFPDY